MRWLYGAAIVAALLVVIGFGATFLTLRYWLLPNVENYRDDIASIISKAIGQRVTIGKIAADWDGLRPHLSLTDVTLFDSRNQPALKLEGVENTLSWQAMLLGKFELYMLRLEHPELTIRRDRGGIIHIAGVAFSQGESHVSDWVLNQRNIIVRDADITWIDEKRGAPPLALHSFTFRAFNTGEHHRFGVHATPARALAAPLDIRGDLHGESLNDLTQWRGTLFTELDYTDLAGWRAWVDFPIEVSRGAGGLRMWLDFHGVTLDNATADIRLQNVLARIRPDLQELDLSAVRGRLAWTSAPNGLEVSAQGLELVSSSGVTLAPADFSVRLTDAAGGKPAKGELRAKHLDLAPIASLVERLPFDSWLRDTINNLAPKGLVQNLVVNWSGDWKTLSDYAVKGDFQDLSMKAFGKIPGFDHLSGSFDGDEQSGSLSLNAHAARLSLPLVFSAEQSLDAFSAQVDWKAVNNGFEFKFGNITFANADLEGDASGSYRTQPSGPGFADIKASLRRSDARQIAKYMPLAVSEGTRDWLAFALQGGAAQDVRFRLSGNLADFPFDDGSRGVFEVTISKAGGGMLEYAKGWPKIENISADVVFRGSRMELTAPKASILGARLSNVHVVIPDLAHHDAVVTITGQAEGAAGEFLRFIENSPVAEMIDHFTDGMRAVGGGKLNLALELPLKRLHESKISGSYVFAGDELFLDPEMLPLQQVNGKLEFSSSGVKMQNVQLSIAGGPAALSGATQRDGTVMINVQGRVSSGDLARAIANPWLQYAHGSADWKGTVVLHKKLPDVIIESNLVGMSLELPEPFGKRADEAVAVKIDRRILNAQYDKLALSYGNVASAELLRRKDQAGRIERGAVRFGEAAALPDQNGIWLGGNLRALDLDAWRALADRSPGGHNAELAGINVRIGSLDVFGKRFNDLALNVKSQGDAWAGEIAGREMNGTVSWKAQGKGKLTGRFKQLTIPESVPGRAAQKEKAPDKQYPSLEISADDFRLKDKNFGKLDLVAVNDGRDWRVDMLVFSNPDGGGQITGAWSSSDASPLTRIDLKLEAADVGKFLGRFGYPDAVKGGTAKMAGQLSWSGSPEDFDYPTLAGNLNVEAHKGQFARYEQGGIGRLLGVLSLQALPRRITLDFKDVFSQGFVFDDISGNTTITNGAMHTDGLKIQGPSAQIEMKGSADLTHETQSLLVRVMPSIGDATAIGALANPLVLAVPIINKVLKNPIDKFFAYEYDITGTWDDPKVSKKRVFQLLNPRDAKSGAEEQKSE